MITAHQPHIFSQSVRMVVSSSADGNMKLGNAANKKEVLKNRRAFLAMQDIAIDQAVLVNIGYDRPNFTQYRKVSKADAGEGMFGDSTEVADALATSQPGVALFLPLADCVGAVLYDPIRNVLMVSHLGRHSIEQAGGYKSVQFLQDTYGCDPRDIKAWLSPAAGGANYPLYAFANRSLHDVIKEQLQTAGALSENIEASPVDTTQSKDFFSHSQFLKGNRTSDGRFAVVAMMLEQGEPAV